MYGPTAKHSARCGSERRREVSVGSAISSERNCSGSTGWTEPSHAFQSGPNCRSTNVRSCSRISRGEFLVLSVWTHWLGRCATPTRGARPGPARSRKFSPTSSFTRRIIEDRSHRTCARRDRSLPTPTTSTRYDRVWWSDGAVRWATPRDPWRDPGADRAGGVVGSVRLVWAVARRHPDRAGIDARVHPARVHAGDLGDSELRTVFG